MVPYLVIGFYLKNKSYIFVKFPICLENKILIYSKLNMVYKFVNDIKFSKFNIAKIFSIDILKFSKLNTTKKFIIDILKFSKFINVRTFIIAILNYNYGFQFRNYILFKIRFMQYFFIIAILVLFSI